MQCLQFLCVHCNELDASISHFTRRKYRGALHELAAQRAATPPGPPVGQVVAKAPVAEPVQLAANEQRLTKPVTVGKVAALPKPTTADISTLVPRDSASKPRDELRRDDRYNGYGVNCSLYPSRC